MANLRQRRVSVGAKRRKSWLMAATALAPLSLGISGPALAQCSAVDASGNATCLSGTYTDIVPQPPGTFPAPIKYGQPTLNAPLNVTLESGVNVTLSNPGLFGAVQIAKGAVNGGPVLLSANGATISVLTPGSGNRGLYVETSSNNATITASGKIDVFGVGGDNHAIKALVNGTVGAGDATVIYGVPGAPGQLLPGAGLSSSGTNS